MIIQQLKENGFEVYLDNGENAYKVILDHPDRCAHCGAKVDSVGFSKARTFTEMYNGNPRQVSMRYSRYRCSNKQCNAYAYTGRDNPISLFLDVSGKISPEVKLAAVLQKICDPSLSTEEICNKYDISRSTLRKELSCLYDKAEMLRSKWIAACDYLVFWPIIYKGRKRGCLFGIDTINHKIGLADIVPESEFVLFLQDYGCINGYGNYSSDECNVILKVDESVLMILLCNSESYQITVTEEEYDKLEQYISTILSPDHFRRLNEVRAESSKDSNNFSALLTEIENTGKDETKWKIDYIEEYARWTRNSVQFDRDYIERTLVTMKEMWDNHLSDREILLHFVFTGTLLKEGLRHQIFDIICR